MHPSEAADTEPCLAKREANAMTRSASAASVSGNVTDGASSFPDSSKRPRKAVQSVPSAAALVSAGAVGSDTLSTEILSVDTVSLFPRVVGHYGLVFAGLTVLLFLPFSLRAASVAASSRSRFHAILTMAITLLVSLRVLLAALSSFGILSVSLPGFPFLMSSTTDLCSQLFLTGLLCGVSGRNDADLAEDAHLAMLAK